MSLMSSIMVIGLVRSSLMGLRKRDWSSSQYLKMSDSRKPQIIMDPSVVSKQTGSSYDGPGKTTVTIANEMTTLLMVDSYSVSGFRLNNGMKVFGPMALFPTAIFSWKLLGAHEVNEASLALFTLVDPKPEVLIVGLGDSTAKANFKVIFDMKQKGINVSLLPTEHAVSTYNYLCAEERLVAGAFIPPDRTRNPLFHEMVKQIEQTKGPNTFFSIDMDNMTGEGSGSLDSQRLNAYLDRVKSAKGEGDPFEKK